MCIRILGLIDFFRILSDLLQGTDFQLHHVHRRELMHEVAGGGGGGVGVGEAQSGCINRIYGCPEEKGGKVLRLYRLEKSARRLSFHDISTDNMFSRAAFW